MTQSAYRRGAENVSLRFPSRTSEEVAAKLNEIVESLNPGHSGGFEAGVTLPLPGGGARVEIERVGEPYGRLNLGPDGAVLAASENISQRLSRGS